MAYYNKIGLLLLNEDRTKFLVCEPGAKYKAKVVTQYLMPGGQIEEDDDIECLKREIKEELDTELDESTVVYIGEYEGPAAYPGRDIMMRIYQAKLLGEPKASSEIGALHWIGAEDAKNPKVSTFIKTKVIPDLVKRDLLKNKS